MIAMKMEYVIKAPKTGTVTKVPHKIGDFVTKGTALVEFADEEWCNRINNWLKHLDIYYRDVSMVKIFSATYDKQNLLPLPWLE